ncbi:MAG TPA: SpoIIE family protein phosphatase [Solirubrobacteraceae bacterium]|nr:SpoIIE family protein phosphatase [Solirubrobacteraceae bacterium]
MPRPGISHTGSVSGLADAFNAQRSVGLALIDRELRFLSVSPALEDMNEMPAERFVGRRVLDVWPAAAAELEPLLRAALAGEAAADVEFLAGERVFTVSYVPLPDPQAAIALIVVERTADRRAEVQIRIAQQRLALALEGTETGSFEWDARTDELQWSDNMGPLWGQPRGWQPASYEEYLQTLHPDDRAVLSDAVRRAREAGEGYTREFRCVWPDGSVRWMESRVHVLEAEGRPAVLVGLVIDTDERRRRELAAEYLASASLALGETLDVRSTLQHVVELAVPELADWCSVHLADEDGAVEQIAVAHHDPALAELARRLQERYPRPDDAPTGVPAVIRTGRSELYPDIPDELLVASAVDDEHLALMRALQLRSVMIVPVVARGRTVGAMTFVFAGSGRSYGTMELELAEELGRRAGVALDNARLHRGERDAHRRLRQLQSITDVALTHLDLDSLLAELLGRLRDVIGADSARVLLADAERGDLVVRAAQGAGLEATLGERLPRDAVQGIPLRASGQTIGVLDVTTSPPDGFTNDELEVLERAADRVAVAIDHARLYEHMRDTAVTLQRSLLPPALPAVRGITSAVRYIAGQEGTEVGGDWYDVFNLADGRLAVAVGDVAGRGVRAAAGMGQLRGALRAYAVERSHPAEALQRLDAFVAGLGGVGFATIALVALDPETGEGSICLAGHPPPVLRTAAGGAAILATEAGAPIGASPASRPVTPLRLERGDTLLLYTDGLVERRGRLIDDQIGELAAAAADAPQPAEAFVDHVLARMLGGAGSRDDVAVVALQRVD